MSEPISRLRRADRPRVLTADERSRLRRRIGIDQPDAGQPPLLKLAEVTPAASGPRRSKMLLVAAAGALLLVLALALWRPESSTETAATGPIDACVLHLPAATAALERWGGLEPWLLSDNGEPDVGSRVVDLLDSLAEVDTDPAIASAATQLRAALAAAPEGASMAERLALEERRSTTVRESLDLILDVLSRLPDDRCDPATLRAAR